MADRMSVPHDLIQQVHGGGATSLTCCWSQGHKLHQYSDDHARGCVYNSTNRCRVARIRDRQAEHNMCVHLPQQVQGGYEIMRRSPHLLLATRCTACPSS
jgi:hypothetical protein